MLEGYLAKYKDYPKDEVKVVVTRSSGSILSPSWDLLWNIKDDRITWEEYERRFREEIMNNSEAMKKLKWIKRISKDKDVRLICYEKNYPCHRFILMDIIMET